MRSNAEVAAESATEMLGLKLTESGRANVVTLLETFMVVDPGHGVLVEQDGERRHVTKWMTDLLSSNPGYFTSAGDEGPSTVDQSLPSTASAFDRIRQGMAVERRQQLVAMAAEVKANPYAKSTFNMTSQSVLEQVDPERAARYRAEAGVSA
ncbi:MAG TPA: hypothetical protein VHL98_11730 [Microvirga sp.]|jgi:hypothetical protein|nr:hypothetical protein [Microvirga sp.]